MANQFQLESAITLHIESIASAGTLSSEDMKELKTHLYDAVENLMSQGLSEQEAFAVAMLRLGQQEELSKEYEKVNGTNMLNKEWVFIFVGVGIAIISGNVLQTIAMFTTYYTAIGSISPGIASTILASVHLLFMGFAILFFKKGTSITEFIKSQVFDKKRLAITIFAVASGLFILIPLPKFFGRNMYMTAIKASNDVHYANNISEMIMQAAIPITVCISILLSTLSVKNNTSWSTLFRSNNYVYILILGFGLEMFASLSRFLFHIVWFTPIIFGIVITTGVAAFVFFNRLDNKLWLKTIFFAAVPLTIELTASIIRGEGDWFNSPLFYFGIGTIISVALGMFIGFWLIKRSVQSIS